MIESLATHTQQNLSARLASERRVVTILFSDIVGSTAAAGRLDPEEWSELINEIFACMISPVERYGGTIARLMGDAILAFFGAPEAHEDDPQRAVLAGLDIVASFEPLRQRMQQEHGLDVNVRVGINTGLVVVGEFGARGQTEYTAMGDAINLAARMEQTALPGTVHISDATYRHVAPLVDAEALSPVDVKGKEEPQLTYRVRAVRADQPRRRGSATVRAELIGRVQELAALQAAAGDVRRGRGQIICLIGEAGLGKSRLVSELHDTWQAESDPEHDLWLPIEALSYGGSQPYLLFRRLIQALAGVRDRDSPSEVTTKVHQLLVSLGLDAQSISMPLGSLVAGATDGAGAWQPSGDAARRELFAAVTELGRAVTGRSPAVVVLEDLHWADSASIELLEHLFQLSDQHAVLFLCTFRPDRQSAAWALKVFAELNFPHRYRELTLQPLHADATMALTGSLLAGAQISDALRELILGRAEGNPLFVEEIVRSLIDQGILVRSDDGGFPTWRQAPDAGLERVAIPDTLRALLLERIDRLEPEARRLLQLAAVIGRRFAFRVLEAICDGVSEPDRHLATLQRVGLVREVSWYPDREYEFHHALILDATYETVLRRQRRDDHLRVGEAIERLYADRPNEFAAELGRHFAEAGDPRAMQYFKLAGDEARKFDANREAAGYYSRAIDLPGVEPNAELYLASGMTYATLGMFDTAREQLETARDLARQHTDLKTEQEAIYELAELYTSRDYSVAERFAEQSLMLARQLQDRRVEAKALNRLGNIHANLQHFSEALSLHHQALRIFEELGDRWGEADCWDLIAIAQMLGSNMRDGLAALDHAIALFEELDDKQRLASSANIYGMNYQIALDGSFSIYRPREQYRESAERGLRISREIGWRDGEAFAMIALSGTSLGAGDFDLAREQGETASALALEIDHAQWILFSAFELGLIACEMLDYARALTHFEQAAELADATGSRVWQDNSRARVALCRWRLGDVEGAEALLLPMVAQLGEILSQGQQQTLFTLSEMAVERRDPHTALAYLDRMVLDPNNPPAPVALVRGETHALLGQVEEADAELLHARHVAQDVGPRTLLWKIAAARSRLWDGRDDALSATEDRQAQQDREALAATISDPVQRAHFLAAAAG